MKKEKLGFIAFGFIFGLVLGLGFVAAMNWSWQGDFAIGNFIFIGCVCALGALMGYIVFKILEPYLNRNQLNRE